MRLAVIGGTGRTGRLVLDEARRRGHGTVAITRRPEMLPVGPLAPTTVVAGEAADASLLKQAIEGADAVIATVPGGNRANPHAAEPVARAAIRAMQEASVPRLVVTSAYPIVGERPRLAMWMLRKAFRVSYADAAALERAVVSSDLDWTIARLNRLVDGPARGGVHATSGQLTRPGPVPRADAAALLVDLAEESGTGRRALNVAGLRRRRWARAPAPW